MDQEKNIPIDQTAANLDELFRLLDAQEEGPSENNTDQSEMNNAGPLKGREAAMAEYIMMMRQYDALLEQFQAMEPDERAEEEALADQKGKENNHAGQAE